MPVPPIGYQSNYEVRTYEIDSRKRMTIPALARLMQEAASGRVISISAP